MATFTMADGSGTRTFEVGDKVRVTAETFLEPDDEDYGDYIGLTGEVIEIIENGYDWPIRVQFDNAKLGYDIFAPEELTHL